MIDVVDKVAAAIHGVEGIMLPFEAIRDDAKLKLSLRRRARAAIEAMRDVPDLCYDGYRCDKMWRELNSKEVWNLWLDAALQAQS